MKKKLTIILIIVPLFVIGQNKYIESYAGVFSLWWFPGFIMTKVNDSDAIMPYNFGLTFGSKIKASGNSYNIDLQ